MIVAVVIAHRQNQIIFMYFCVDFNEMTGFFLFFISRFHHCLDAFDLLHFYFVSTFDSHLVEPSSSSSFDRSQLQCFPCEELRMRTQIDRFLLNYFAYNLVLIYLYHRAFFLTGYISTTRACTSERERATACAQEKMDLFFIQ